MDRPLPVPVNRSRARIKRYALTAMVLMAVVFGVGSLPVLRQQTGMREEKQEDVGEENKERETAYDPSSLFSSPTFSCSLV
jgi:hypothetical protein